MRSFGELWRSTIITKWVMAITGILIVGFLLAHVSGNLLIFAGRAAMNEYGVWLRELGHGTLIWALRVGLLVAFVLHIWSGIRMAALNRAARPVGYKQFKNRTSSLPARTMLLTGVLILLYAGYHLAHFTWGIAHPEYYHGIEEYNNGFQTLTRPDIYTMVIQSFQQPLIVVIYLLSMVVVTMHLNHAINSAFQTLGINHPKYNTLLINGSRGLSVLIFLAYSSIPVAILTGFVK